MKNTLTAEQREHARQVIKRYTEEASTNSFGLLVEVKNGRYSTRVFIADKEGKIKDLTNWTAKAGAFRLERKYFKILSGYNMAEFIKDTLSGFIPNVTVYTI